MALLCPLLTSAPRSSRLAAPSVPISGTTAQISPGKSDRLPRTPPDLQTWPLMDMDFATRCPLVRPRMPPIRFLSVRPRFCSALPSDAASRRPPLCFANPSPPSGWTGDFHSQAIEHAGHTTNRSRGRRCLVGNFLLNRGRHLKPITKAGNRPQEIRLTSHPRDRKSRSQGRIPRDADELTRRCAGALGSGRTRTDTVRQPAYSPQG